MITKTVIATLIAVATVGLIAMAGLGIFSVLIDEPQVHKDIRAYYIETGLSEQIANDMEIETDEVTNFIDGSVAYCGTLSYKDSVRNFAAYDINNQFIVVNQSDTMAGYYATCEPDGELGKQEKQFITTLLRLNSQLEGLAKQFGIIIPEQDDFDK